SAADRTLSEVAAGSPSPTPSAPAGSLGVVPTVSSRGGVLLTAPSGSLGGGGGRESPVDPLHIQAVLTRGTRMVKFPNKSSSRPEERLIRVNLHPLQMTWESKKKKSVLSTADFHAIKEIRLGQSTKAFDLHGKRVDAEERAFSVIYSTASGTYKMLNLVAPTKEACAVWVAGLHMLLARVESAGEEVVLHRSVRAWLRRVWEDVDATGAGRLGLDGVTELMKRLNVRLSRVEVKSTFKNADISKTGYLSFEAFERLYRALRFRPEIAGLFASLACTNTSYITLLEFRNFLVEVQKISWSEARILEIYKKYSSDQQVMDMDHFSAFLMSANNSIFKKTHATTVYQDMSRPISEYYINSSHNTYLLGDQLKSESSIEGYIRALQKGCRCLELDCFDGPQGPVIYHKNSFTNKISFKEVIDVIARYAFVASVYPLFLSLEVHCSEEQQAMMAKIMVDGFGDHLFSGPIPAGQCELPSPAELAFKIVIKGKVQPPAATSSCDGDDEPDFDAEEEDSSSGRASPLTPLDLTWPVAASSQILEPRLSFSSVGTTATAAGVFVPDQQAPLSTMTQLSTDATGLDRQYQLLAASEFKRLLSSTPSSEDDVGQPVSDGGSDADSVRSSPPSAPGRLARHPSNSSGLASTFFDRRPTPADDGPRKRGGGNGWPIAGTLARRNSTQKPRRHPVDRSLSDLIVLCKSASFVGTEMF
ncbi:1-phosphatidylinositol 4,5-bisphosphate phosphodiesterase delta-4, partial [Cladochytrium tenue]